MKNIFVISLFCTTALFLGCKDSNKQQGNWTFDSQAEEMIADTVIVEDNTSMNERDQQKAVEQEELVKDFYEQYVFGEKPVKMDILSHYCTERLIKKLQQDYDYEGGGYAIWEFRTDNQDGPSRESRITSIKVISPLILEVHFIDMGHKGSHNIHFRPDGAKYKMDEIE